MDTAGFSGVTLGGRYRLVRLLGQGGMGAVYEAVQEDLGRRVAVKVIRPDLGDRAARARFRREATLAAALGHPNIVQVTDFVDGSVDGREPPFFVMELLEGESLADALRREERLAPRRVGLILLQVLSALSALHRAGVVHRDLKPSNVFLARMAGVGEVVKLLDFGVAKLEDGGARLTGTGRIVGTLKFMAPEQLLGLDVDARTDLYSLGVVAFCALAGRLPYGGLAETVSHAIVVEPPLRLRDVLPNAPSGLARVVDRSLEKDPSARFGSADEMAAEVERCLEGAPAEVSAASTELAGGAAVPAPSPTGPTAAATPHAIRRGAVPPTASGERRPRSVGLSLALGLLLGVLVAAIAVVAFVGLGGEPEAPVAPGPTLPVLVAAAADAGSHTPTASASLSKDAGLSPPALEEREGVGGRRSAQGEGARGAREGQSARGSGATAAPELEAERSEEASDSASGSRGPSESTEVETSAAAARVVDISGTRWVEVGDMTYRLVARDLALGGLYSAIDLRFTPMVDADLACLARAGYRPPSSNFGACLELAVTAEGHVESVTSTPPGDATYDDCTRRAFRGRDLGPTNTGEAGTIRFCIRTVIRR
jgi:serine/threonine-protein kinase